MKYVVLIALYYVAFAVILPFAFIALIAELGVYGFLVIVLIAFLVVMAVAPVYRRREVKR